MRRAFQRRDRSQDSPGSRHLSPRLLVSGDDLYLHESFRRDPDGQPEDGWWARLGTQMWRVFFLQFLPSPWLEENCHGIIFSTQLNYLLGNFVADPHTKIILVTFYCEEVSEFPRRPLLDSW
jgi:hypothetical protein